MFTRTTYTPSTALVFSVVDTPPDLSAVSGTGAAAGQYYEDNSNYGDEEDRDDANCDNRFAQ